MSGKTSLEVTEGELFTLNELSKRSADLYGQFPVMRVWRNGEYCAGNGGICLNHLSQEVAQR